MTEAIISFAAGHIAGKLIDKVSKDFKTSVIERWTKSRAQQFFETFCYVIEEEITTKKITTDSEVFLDMILEDEIKTEILYDAYRSVCFSKSKNIGPRIIGLLTAKLIIDGLGANEYEEKIFMAAESLTDKEFENFWNYAATEYISAGADSDELPSTTYDEIGNIEIACFKEQFDSNFKNRTSVSIAPINLEDHLGSWAIKLKNLGIIQDDMKESQWDYKADCDRGIDQNGTIREISWHVRIPKQYLNLIGLIEKACPSKTSEYYGFSYLNPDN